MKETTVKTAVKEEFITGGKKWTVGWLNWFNAESSLKRYWRGPRSEEVGVRRRLYLTLYTLSPPEEHLHFKMGSNESHFKVSLIVRGKVTKTVSSDHNFWRERRAEADLNRGPSAYQRNALLLG